MRRTKGSEIDTPERTERSGDTIGRHFGDDQ